MDEARPVLGAVGRKDDNNSTTAYCSQCTDHCLRIVDFPDRNAPEPRFLRERTVWNSDAGTTLRMSRRHRGQLKSEESCEPVSLSALKHPGRGVEERCPKRTGPIGLFVLQDREKAPLESSHH
jgi:hypothetical protein